MFNILENVTNYNDTWNITFYFVVALALLIAIFWTYMQVVKNKFKKKEDLKENVIYDNSEDMIEDGIKYHYNKNKTH